MRVLGINAIFPDLLAALVADGQIIATAEEERFTQCMHGDRPLPFTASEPDRAARQCDSAGLVASRVRGLFVAAWARSLPSKNCRRGKPDAVGYPHHPALTKSVVRFRHHNPGGHLLRTCARQAPSFRPTAVCGLDLALVRQAGGQVTQAAAAGLLHPYGKAARQAAFGRNSLARFLTNWNRASEEGTR